VSAECRWPVILQSELRCGIHDREWRRVCERRGKIELRIKELIWLEEIVEKLWVKHQVGIAEVRDVLESRPRFRFVEKGHRRGEDLYVALGRTDAGRYLTVFFVLKGDGQALVVSARDMTASERKRHEQG